ncbi:unnamed protein product [Urochloa humidicola]
MPIRNLFDVFFQMLAAEEVHIPSRNPASHPAASTPPSASSSPANSRSMPSPWAQGCHQVVIGMVDRTEALLRIFGYFS